MVDDDGAKNLIFSQIFSATTVKTVMIIDTQKHVRFHFLSFW